MAEMRHRTYREGVLVSDETIEVEPTPPTTEERLDALTDAVEALALDLLMGGQ